MSEEKVSEDERALHVAYINAVEWEYSAHTYIARNLPPAVYDNLRKAVVAMEMGLYVDDRGCDKGRFNLCVPDSQFRRRKITLSRVVRIDPPETGHTSSQ
jgi:hypothetical protein